MSRIPNLVDAMIAIQPLLEKMRSLHPDADWPTEDVLQDIPDRRCKQRIVVKAFAYGMPLELPTRINPMEASPIANGHEFLFNEEYSPTDPFCTVDILVAGERRLHSYWDNQGNCFASIDKGSWLADSIRWGIAGHRDPRRLADLHLGRQLLNGLFRGGHVQKGRADVTAFCCDDNGFGGELRVRLHSDSGKPAWPYFNPEDGEPDSKNLDCIYVSWDRKTLYTVKWGAGDSGIVASVYSELGHFHEPLLRWAQSI